MKSDTALTKQIAKGSIEAFEIIYNRYNRSLFYMAQNYQKDKQLAEAAIHDVFVKLLERKESLHSLLSLNGYIFTILKNYLINTSRDRNKPLFLYFICQKVNSLINNIPKKK